MTAMVGSELTDIIGNDSNCPLGSTGGLADISDLEPHAQSGKLRATKP